MTRRISRVACVAVVLAMAVSAASAQTSPYAPFMGKSSFSPSDEAQMTAITDTLITDMLSTDEGKVNRARAAMVDAVEDSRATEQFKAVAAKIIADRLGARLNNAVVHRSRLAVAIVAAKLQTPESLALLLRLLGEPARPEVYPSVRYWAAKGLAGERMKDIIRKESAGIPGRVVLKSVSQVLDTETQPVCVGVMFLVLDAVQTESATDVLIKAVAEKARALDLGRRDAADAMKSAVPALKEAYAREIRPAAAGKQPIVATLAQVLAQTPPHGPGLELAVAVDEALAALTNETTGLAAAVEVYEDQSRLTDPKVIDIIWLQQLNWVEVLLKTSNKDVRLLSRPAILDWSAAKSVETVRKMAAKQGR